MRRNSSLNLINESRSKGKGDRTGANSSVFKYRLWTRARKGAPFRTRPVQQKSDPKLRSLFAFNRMGLLLNLGREELTVQAGIRPLGKGDGGM